MYGRQGTIVAKTGQRDALLALLLEGSSRGDMPGCRLYVISRVPAQPDVLAISEVWDDQAAHTASLSLPNVRAVIARALPLIASMGEGLELDPVGGKGLD
jgi:quinol monooxygenase YgiN